VILQRVFFCSCHALAYVITANGVCLHLSVPPLAPCCFFGTYNYMHVLWHNRLEREKHRLQQLHSKKWGGLVFKGGPTFSEVKPGYDWIDMYPITPLCHTCNTHTLVLQQMKAQGSPTICGARGCVEEQLLVQM